MVWPITRLCLGLESCISVVSPGFAHEGVCALDCNILEAPRRFSNRRTDNGDTAECKAVGLCEMPQDGVAKGEIVLQGCCY